MKNPMAYIEYEIDPGPTSGFYWYPKIAHLPYVPRTILVRANESSLFAAIDGQDPVAMPMYYDAMEAVKAAADQIGYPAFIRTDLASAKHDGQESYLASDKSRVANVMLTTIESNVLKGLGGFIQGFMVREYLHLRAPFIAFRGHPVAREFRLFFKHERVVCHHPYWPEAAIHFGFGQSEPHGWKESLAAISELESSEEEHLYSMAHQAGALCKDAWPDWSIDFAQDEAGKWWLIDMARAHQSWHPEDCPHVDKRE